MQAIRIQNMHDVGLNGILSYMGYIAIGLDCIRIPSKISYFLINFNILNRKKNMFDNYLFPNFCCS